MIRRAAIIETLTAMPDEAFGWLVLAMQAQAMLHGGRTQIWPDGLGGFTEASRHAIERLRLEAAAYILEATGGAPAAPDR